MLDLGADDCIARPVHLNEPLARTKMQLRRDVCEVLAPGELEVHPDQRLARCSGQELHCSFNKFELLVHLRRQPGRVHSRAELIRALWGNLPGYSNVLDVQFATMRGKLRAVHLDGLLRTVSGATQQA